MTRSRALRSRTFALCAVPFAAVALLLGSCSRLGGGSTEVARLLAREKRKPIDDPRDCLNCHEKIGRFYAASVHRNSLGCQNCHGPGGDHAEDPPGHIVRAAELLALSPQGRSELCLGCHRSYVASWPAVEHARAGLSCWSCHTDVVHFRQPDAVRAPAAFASSTGFCEQCHAAAVAELRQPYHHPVLEGEIGCLSCHDIHGEPRRLKGNLGIGGVNGTEVNGVSRLGGWGQPNCVGCHPRAGQQKVFRHPAMDEGCQVCHAPHGSPLPSLLTRTANNLCLQCHFEPGFPTIAGVDHSVFLARAATCWDCHIDVHGSNSDPSLLGRVR